MKQILIILCLLWGTVQAQTIGYLRYDSVKIAKPGGNAELIIENATKAVTGGVLTNTGNGRSAWVAAGGSWTPTWQQTLTAGSTLTGDNSVDLGGNDLEFTGGAGTSGIGFTNLLEFSTTISGGATLALTGVDINITSPVTSSRSSSISFFPDSIYIKPSLGNLYIDTFNYSANADDSMMVWQPSTGHVGIRAIPSGGSGANTALSNLASVAINTSLLPGVSDNIDLGSTTFQWRNLYLGEGQKIDWDNGDATLTQVGNNVTLDGAAFIVTSPEQTPASFSSSFAGNMLVPWNSSTSNNVNFAFQKGGTTQWYVGNNASVNRLHILNASAQEAITVLQGLQVGINQTAPTARLHIGAGASTANYAPQKFTTGTFLTVPEVGAFEYVTPQTTFTNGRGIRQEWFQGQQSRVSVQYDNATTTLGNVTGLTANVAASGTYRFEAKLYTTSDVAGGIKVAIGGTATATAIRYEGLTTDAGLTTQGRATALGTAVGAVTAVTAAYVVITGTITVNGAGTLTVQAAANAATGTTSVLTGSTFVITEML